MESFTGKVVIVTGSSSGIGAAAAVKFAKLGADIVVTGRNKERLEKVAIECAKVSPKKEKGVHQIIGDVTKDADCENLIKGTVEHFGKLDILVNNAGIGVITPFNDPKIMDKYALVMNTDLRSVFFLTHLAVPYLEKTKGQIINISSVAGLKPVYIPIFPSSIYCMAKSAVDMFTRCMALELGPKGIRVNAINPGVIKTNINDGLGIPKEELEKLLDTAAKTHPLGRVGEPEEVANAIAFVASNDASFITGINLVIDGAESLMTGGVPKLD